MQWRRRRNHFLGVLSRPSKKGTEEGLISIDFLQEST